MPLTVVVVDQNLWVRLGRSAALVEQGGFEVIHLDHRSAMELGPGWSTIDVALINAHDDAAPFDRFPGVGVVEALRSQGKPTATAILVSRLEANPYLALRLAEAGADYCYRHEQVAAPEGMVRVITEPTSDHRVVRPNRAALASIGLGPEARANAALRFIVEEGLDGAFDGRRSQKALPLSRRTIMRVRREVGQLTGLRSPIGSARDLDAPNWRTVVDFVNRARGVERRRPSTRRSALEPSAD